MQIDGSDRWVYGKVTLGLNYGPWQVRHNSAVNQNCIMSAPGSALGETEGKGNCSYPRGQNACEMLSLMARGHF